MNIPRWALAGTLGSCVLSCPQGVPAQTASPQPASACGASQIELYDGGGEGATGHFVEVYELRNKSRTQCDLTGIPALRFFDKAGSPISLDYLKNLSAFMFSAEPVHSVLLQPGEFAHFLVGWDVCNDTPCWHPDSMAILLPNGKFLSKTPARWQGVGKLSVSAVRTGLKQDYLDELPPKDKERLLTLSAGR